MEALGYEVGQRARWRAETACKNVVDSLSDPALVVDMQSGKLLKVGVHSGSGSRRVKHNLGFAEPPPAAPILEKIMTRLSEVLLED